MAENVEKEMTSTVKKLFIAIVPITSREICVNVSLQIKHAKKVFIEVFCAVLTFLFPLKYISKTLRVNTYLTIPKEAIKSIKSYEKILYILNENHIWVSFFNFKICRTTST